MSNPYASISDLAARFDVRQTAMISNDTGADVANATKLQAALDDAAGELETTVLAGRVPLPLLGSVGVLTKWVCIKAIEGLYRNRVDKPKGLQSDLDWCASFAKEFRAGIVSLPGVTRSLSSPAEQDVDAELAAARAELTKGL